MKTLIVITLLCLLGFLLMLRMGTRDAKNIDGDEPDEHSPAQLDLDVILNDLRKTAALRTKLNAIEAERKTLNSNEK